MLSVWRATDDRYPMETRMGLTYREAGLSIVITTMIDILTILVGAVGHIPAIKYFCIYTCFCVFFAFTMQVFARTHARTHAHTHAYYAGICTHARTLAYYASICIVSTYACTRTYAYT